MKNNKHYIDLSDIKDDELDKTSSFIDLMSRSEKKERERLKEEEKTRELKELLMSDNNQKKEKKKKEKKKKELDITPNNKTDESIAKEINEVNTDNLSKTQRFIDFTREIQTSMLNNVDNNLDIKIDKKKKSGFASIMIIDFFIILSLIFYIYSILFTDIQSNQLYLLIGGGFILLMITLFCLSIISNRALYKIFSILNYLTFIGYILFNLTLVLGIIKL